MNPLPFRYITTPIYYVNDRPHLGHLYTSVAGDILARFYKMLGYRVKFVTGTDEHGAKVAQAAHSQGMSALEYVDSMADAFQRLIHVSCIQADDFIRTTQERHHQAATALWDHLQQNGSIYLDHYTGWYAIRDEAYYEESELVDGPHGKIAPTGAPVEWVQEPCYFFRLSQFQTPLIEHYENNPDAIAPDSRRNEVLSFLKSGLRDLAVSRSKVTWGIGVPGSHHVMYVWVDALTNYLTALGYPSKDSLEFTGYWNQSIHLMGKDILRFHAVYWPALLMAAGLNPPKRLFAHGWWMSEGQKMSKSLGNVIDPFALIQRYGADRLRYFLFRHVRFGQDGDFSKDLFEHRCNQELADGLGNLVHRVLSFVGNRLGGVMPLWLGDGNGNENGNGNGEENGNVEGVAGHPRALYAPIHVRAEELRLWARHQCQEWIQMMEDQNIYGYLESIYSGMCKGNAYMAELAPWALLKAGDSESIHAMNHGLYALASFLRDMALALWPVMPNTAESIWSQLGLDGTIGQYARPGYDLLGGAVCARPGYDLLGGAVSTFDKMGGDPVWDALKQSVGLGQTLTWSGPLAPPTALFSKEF